MPRTWTDPLVQHEQWKCDQVWHMNIIRVTKSRRMRLVGHAARMGHRRGAYKVSVERSEGEKTTRKTHTKLKDNTVKPA